MHLFKPRSYSSQNVSFSPSVGRLIIETPLQGFLQGGEFVTARAREMAQGGSGRCSFVTLPVQRQPEKLRGSERFGTPERLSLIAQNFDEGLKRVFSDDMKVQFVKVGFPSENDPQHGVKGGKLKFTG